MGYDTDRFENSEQIDKDHEENCVLKKCETCGVNIKTIKSLRDDIKSQKTQLKQELLQNLGNDS